MLEKRSVIYEYEEILLGKRRSFSYANAGSDSERREIIGIIWNYAITNLLHWTPEDALAYLNPDIVKMLKLDLTLKFIKYGYNTKKNFDYEYVLALAFPGQVVYNLKTQCINEYEHVLHVEKYANIKDNYQFHKKFFNDDEGLVRAAIVLNYAISRYLGYMTIEELYDFFSDEKQAMKFLKKYKIANNARLMFANPLDYFHNSLGDRKDPFLYYYHLFKKEYNKANNEQK